MRTIPLDATPNQQMTVNIGQNRWTLKIKQAVSSMIADVSLNDSPLLYGVRICVGTPIIPFKYLSGTGNFLLLSDNEELADWKLFGSSQQLLYVDPGELLDEVPLEWAGSFTPYDYDFETYADALYALNTDQLVNNQPISVKVDETQGGIPTRYVVYIANATLTLDFANNRYDVSPQGRSLTLVT